MNKIELQKFDFKIDNHTVLNETTLNDTMNDNATLNDTMNDNDLQFTNSHFDKNDISAIEGTRLTKLKKKINSDSWSNELEDIMKAWGEKAAGNREMHENACKRWKTFSNNMYVPILFMSTITGVTNIGAANTDHSNYWMYSIGTLNILSAFMTGILKYYKPDEKAERHSSIAKSFGSFYRHLTLELGMSREDRTSSDELTKWAKLEFDRMQKDAPMLPTDIIKIFKKKHPSQINLPDVAIDTFHIEIHGR